MPCEKGGGPRALVLGGGNLQKEKWRFLAEGVPTAAGLVDRVVNQGSWLQERVGWGRRDGSSKKRGRLGWLAVPKTGGEAPRPGARGVPRASVPGG